MGGGRILLSRLFLRGFRNLEECVVEPAPRFNLVFGDNGHGKTSLIEAIYVLSTTKSFRSTRIAEAIQDGAPQALLSAEVESYGLPQQLRAQLHARGRSFLLNGKRPSRYVDYALKTPVIAFHPGDLALTSGPASERRTLLDRVMLYIDPGGADARAAYQTAMRHRQQLLETGSLGAELDAYEQVAAEHGARLTLGRERTAVRVKESLMAAFSEMAQEGLSCVASYQAAGVSDPLLFAKELASRRRKDQLRRAATFGPQRDELHLEVGGRSARSHASQGQQRLLTLAMKLAELSCVRDVTGCEPLLLLDDVSSELDPHRTASVFRFLQASESQIFVTTTRPRLFENVAAQGAQRADFLVHNGTVRRATK